MHLGESVLATGAVVMFTVGALRLNAMRLDCQERMLATELQTTALSLAQTYVERAHGLSFDEAVGSVSPAGLRAKLTGTAGMGPDAGESGMDAFDDVDDLHGYADSVLTPRGDYRVGLATAYADSASLAVSDERSLLKWLTVQVSSPHYRDTVRVRYLCAFR